MTRVDYEVTLPKPDEDYMTTYRINRAKRNLRRFNDVYRNSKTEVYDERHIDDPATQMHHIFPANEYPQIADYLENLIALTPTQHFTFVVVWNVLENYLVQDGSFNGQIDCIHQYYIEGWSK